ncbi:MAG: SPOR domain-containing protein [Bacteroidaceae bacterium]|nr:SPOR domain-containing protein [Bacteroidaceae bacterium]
MKRNLILGLAIVSALAFVSCKSTESSYKKAYEKAKAQEQTQQQTAEPIQVTPVVTPVQTVTPVQAAPAEDNSGLRSERLTAMNGGAIKAYNVVCGSFKSLDNANNLCSTLKNKGYAAVVAQNPETGMYRVIATSSDTKSDAVSTRDKLRGTYPDAWLLYRAQ